MNISDYLHLFIDASVELPDHNNDVLAIVKWAQYPDEKEKKDLITVKYHQKKMIWESVFLKKVFPGGPDRWYSITHWLDLSKLMTKQDKDKSVSAVISFTEGFMSGKTGYLLNKEEKEELHGAFTPEIRHYLSGE